MPAPSFAAVTFPNHSKPNALHKSKGNMDTAVFTTCLNISPGDGVTVTGTKGKKTTIWDGTIDSLSGDTATSIDLAVIRLAKDRKRRKKASKRRKAGRGTEDVSTTISNGDVSPPVSQKVEPLP
jgi:hypothetical protein